MRKHKAADGPGLFDGMDETDTQQAPDLPASWREALHAQFLQPYYRQLGDFLVAERARGRVFPDEANVFAALRETPLETVRVLILGQDPYHDEGQAHGLCFSVPPGTAQPPSLRNIFTELCADLGCQPPLHGCLTSWARQGVLLLNSVLTVRAHVPGSHQQRGWEIFTDAVIAAVNARSTPVAFVLWGMHARKKIKLIDTGRHLVVASAHPSPLSARNGFFGSKPFSRINTFLRSSGQGQIDWSLKAEADSTREA